MTELVDSSIAQYAVIEARRTEGPSEPFVIAYPDEESLRDLIAGPSIIACGFATRKEAQAKVDAGFWTAAAWERTCRGLTVVGAEEYPRGAFSVMRRIRRWSSPSLHSVLPRSTLFIWSFIMTPDADENAVASFSALITLSYRVRANISYFSNQTAEPMFCRAV